MSSKNAPEQLTQTNAPARPARPWSLAARLTAWYAGSAFALIVAATGYLYWSSVSNLDREDDHLLGDRVRELRAVMVKRPGDVDALRQEVEEEWEANERRIHMRILNEHSEILIETPAMGQLLPPSSFPTPAAEPAQGVDVESAKGGLFRVLAVHHADNRARPLSHIIQVAIDRTLESELRDKYRENLAVVLGAALLVCAVVGYQIARRGIQPIHNITETARRIRPTNLAERIAPDGLPAELLTLADTFNDMLDRLEQSFVRLSRFSADIAHELRTPVYSLRGEVEVVLSKARSPEEYRDVLSSNLEECSRLAHLIDRMLFLARAENPETQLKREACDVGRELATVCEFYGVAALEGEVNLTVVATQHVEADLDRSLFQRAVGNLVANALTHTPAGGTVTLSAHDDSSAITVEVADTGAGIRAADLPHVFDRFFRADPTRSSRNGSVGLGLAIVKSIMDMHGGSVAVTSEVGRGTCVKLTFPSVPVPHGRPSAG
jgi:two-component system heavy metal sensor histidine kinase CusS